MILIKEDTKRRTKISRCPYCNSQYCSDNSISDTYHKLKRCKNNVRVYKSKTILRGLK